VISRRTRRGASSRCARSSSGCTARRRAVIQATSLPAISAQSGGDGDILSSLEAWLGSLTQLTTGAVARLSTEHTSLPPPSTVSVRSLSVAVSRVLSGAEGTLESDVLRACIDELLSGVPAGVGRVISGVIWGLADLPVEKAEEASIELSVHKRLPDWIPPRRTLGGFYVLRGLGGGNVGSVFVVTRYEDRFDPHAEKFALKVPEYSATAARSLSEAEFLVLFRFEASALLAIPAHPNVARFVTFDAGARPKPILVMELVMGPTLDAVIQSHALDVPRCLRLLDDVLAGLEAMHTAGVGHLDLKPTNVVIREGDEAVLVDFGLAGRHIRPGCGTGPYGAPEVWGAGPQEQGVTLTPFAADVYAFGCVAFEALTGRILFEAPNEVAQITQHVAHDGMPPRLEELAKDGRLGVLVELLRATLRRDPSTRPSVASVRAGLRKAAPMLTNVPWPAGGT
jgi:serine/threonine protein kinase